MPAENSTAVRRRGGSDLWKNHDPPIKTGPVDHRHALETVRFVTRTQYRMHRPIFAG